MARIKVLKLISILANKNNASKIHPIREYEQDVLIHGCCLIFSEEYINIFDGLDDRTFLYGEEPLLYLRLKKHKLLSVYNPDLKIKHLEDISTNYSIPDFNKRREMQYKNMITSCKIIISELKK
jgi:GT2 family glycosyltransferase